MTPNSGFYTEWEYSFFWVYIPNTRVEEVLALHRRKHGTFGVWEIVLDGNAQPIVLKTE